MKYEVKGMSCAACVARVEKAVNGLDGVTDCSVSLLTGGMMVEGSVDCAAVVAAVEKAGYGCSVQLDASVNADSSESAGVTDLEKSEKSEITLLKNRLFASVPLLIALMYVSMGHMMFNLPLPSIFAGNHLAAAILQLLISSMILVINNKFFINGFKTLLHGSPTMDTLVALGSGISWIYSVVIIFAMTDALVHGGNILSLMDNLYFEGAATIVTLITVGKLLEAVSKGRTTSALKSLMKLSPDTAIVEKDGSQIEIDVKKIAAGDVFLLKPGMRVPVDGIVVEGSSTVDESALTGESIPVDKNEGCSVSAGTMNVSGFLRCSATRTGSDTTLAKIIALVSDASATKAPIARVADKVSGIFVPAVITIALAVIAFWIFSGKELSFALSRGICVLVVSCPCALGLATPVAIMVASGKAAANGILFKTSASLENAGRTKIVALDKTGTVTTGKMSVSSVSVYDGHAGVFDAVALSEVSLAAPTTSSPLLSLMQVALNLEYPSQHPLARAVVKFAEEQGLAVENVTEFAASGGKGVSACAFDGTRFFGGNLLFIIENLKFSQEIISVIKAETQKFALSGKTPLVFAAEKSGQSELLGIICVEDAIKDDARDCVTELKKMGLKVVMITGDNEITSKNIAGQAGIDQVFAQVLPEQKEQIVERLMAEGKVTMVGDGINDSPALVRADTGIAIGSGTDVAVESADVVLMNDRLMDVANAIALSRKTLRNIRQNLFWAFAYNVALIPLAAGAWESFGLEMNPMFGALAMSLSSFCVVSNALRLNFGKLKNKKQKEYKMTKTVKVDGMMCPHCEKHVKEALEKIDGITIATASHEKKEVVLELGGDVADSVIEQAIVDAGYSVIK